MATAEEIAHARTELDAEHATVMAGLGNVWVKMEAVRSAQPTDNVHDLLKDLQDAVGEARDGGLVGSGANAHRRALERWQKLSTDAEQGT
jgi:hypothetical protein